MDPVKQSEVIAKFREIVSHCLQCQEVLKEKFVIKGSLRCKRCQRVYEAHWFSNHQSFLKMFEGQF